MLVSTVIIIFLQGMLISKVPYIIEIKWEIFIMLTVTYIFH